MKNRLPLVIGVTGHCKLEGAEEQVTCAVWDFFRRLRHDYPNTPILLVSSLAEGADQLVVDAALTLGDKPGTGPRIELIVARPAGWEESLRDFSAEGRATYERLAKRAVQELLIPMPESAHLPAGVDAASLPRVLAGAVVASNCHALLAVCSEAWEQGQGMTPWMIRVKLRGRFDRSLVPLIRVLERTPGFLPLYNPLELSDVGPVFSICIPPERGNCLRGEWLVPPVDGEREAVDTARDDARQRRKRQRYMEQFDRIYAENLEEFNRRSRRVEEDPKLRQLRQNEFNDRLPTRMTPHLPEPLTDCLEMYAAADRTAIFMQDRLHRILFWVFILVTAVVLVFSTFAHLTEEARRLWVLGLYVVLLVIADFVYLWIFKRNALSRRMPTVRRRLGGGHDPQTCHQDYRTISEGLRVQFYWRLAGIPDSAADYYLPRQKNELDWIRGAVRASSLLAGFPLPAGPTAPSHDERLRAVKLHWVLDQLNYFIKSTYTNRVKQITLRQLSGGILFASLVTSFALVVLHATNGVINTNSKLLLSAAVLLVAVTHTVAKSIEMKEEAREDEEELHQVDRLAAERPDVKKLPDVKDVLAFWFFRPLSWAVRGRGGQRPRMLRLSWWAFAYGALTGGAVTGLLVGAAALGALVERFRHWFQTDHVTDWLIVAMVLNVAVSALVQWYAEKRAFGAHYRQFKRMRTAFSLGLEALESPGEDPRTILKQLGEEALAEHADWLLLHRDRPIELPRTEL